MKYESLIDRITRPDSDKLNQIVSRALGNRVWRVETCADDRTAHLVVERSMRKPLVVEYQYPATFDHAVTKAIALLKPKKPRPRVASLCNLPGRGRFARA